MLRYLELSDQACGTVGDEECIGVLVVKTEGKSHLEDVVIGGRIILKCFKDVRWEGGDLSNLARARCKRQTFTILVNELPDSVKYGELLD